MQFECVQEISGAFHEVSEAFHEVSRGSGCSWGLRELSDVSGVFRAVSWGLVAFRGVSGMFHDVPVGSRSISRSFKGFRGRSRGIPGDPIPLGFWEFLERSRGFKRASWAFQGLQRRSRKFQGLFRDVP